MKLTLPIVLASVSVLLNIIQFFVGLGKDRRFKRLQDLDYAVRLRLTGEVSVSGEGLGQTLSYSGKLENCGSKLVVLKALRAKWESAEPQTWGRMDHIELLSYLTPGEIRDVQIRYTPEQIVEIKKQLQVWDSRFYLEVTYLDASGKEIVKKYSLANFRSDGSMVTAKWTDVVA